MKRHAYTAHAGTVHAMQPEAFGWLFDEPDDLTVERRGPIAIVASRGALQQRSSWCGVGYDAIAATFAAACASDATTIVLDIDSCGGVVAGCFAAAREMRAAADASGKRVVAYARENACSAAYALATVGDTIALPDTGTVGSVGVIGCVDDYTEAMAKDGVRVTVLTSGARKADGNPMVETTPEAIATLQATVDTLASAFFALVAERRPLSADAVRDLEAGVFLGQAAVDAGLADEVIAYAELMARLSAEGYPMSEAEDPTKDEDKAEAAEGENAEAEGAEMPPGEDDGEDEEASTGDAPAAIAARSHSSRDILAIVRSITGQSSPAAQVGALQALAAEAKRGRKLASKIAKLEADARAREVEAKVDSAIKAGKLTPSQRAWAVATGTQSPAVLDGYLATASRVAPVPAAAAKPVAADDLTDTEKRMASAMGLTEAAFAAQKIAINSRTH
jgi:ClpP class serine protease